MDLVSTEPLGWRVTSVSKTGSKFMAVAEYRESKAKWRKGVHPPYQWMADGRTIAEAKRAVLAKAKADTDFPLILDVSISGIHDWTLSGDDKTIICEKCRSEHRTHRFDPCPV